MPDFSELRPKTVLGVAAHPDNAYRLLHDDRQLALVFPEGTRSRDGLLRRPYPGAAMLGLPEGVTVVPAAVWGLQDDIRRARIVPSPPTKCTTRPLTPGLRASPCLPHATMAPSAR